MEARIVRRRRSGRWFLGIAWIGTTLLVAPALRGQEGDAAPRAAPAPVAGEPAPQRAVSCVLDGIAQATAVSPILSSARPPPLRVELDALEPEASIDGGRQRIFRLETAVLRDPAGRPLAPRLTLGGAEAAAPAGVEVIPARTLVLFKGHPDFLLCKKASDARGNRFVVFEEPTEIAFELPPLGFPARLVLAGRNLGSTEQCVTVPGEMPRVAVSADGEKLGEFELLPKLRDWDFDLPATSAPLRVTLTIDRVTSQKGRIAALQSFAIEARDQHDRLRVFLPEGARAAAVEYHGVTPEAVQLLGSVNETRNAPRELSSQVALMPGRAGIVMTDPQAIEVLVAGKSVAKTGERVSDLVFDAAEHGTRSLMVRGEKGLKGSFWLLQPAAFHLPLTDPLASLSASVPFVRGLETPPGHALAALVRHVMLFGDTRRALLAPVGTEVSIPARILEGDVLDFAVGGAAFSEIDLPKGALGWEVELVTQDGEKHRLDSGELPRRRRTRWESRAARFPEGFAGAARLVFRVFAQGRAPFAATEALFAFAEPTLVHRRGPRRPNLVIYLIDTVRADHCSPWGYRRQTTPALAELASEGILFENAFSQAPWTRPSVATLFTGWLLGFHNASKTTGLAPQIVTIAETLREAGYATTGFIANAHVHGGSLNFEQGFSRFEAVEKNRKREDSRADEVNAAASAWLSAHLGQPFFLYLHTIDPHAPYDPPETTLGTWSDGYRGSVTAELTNARALKNRADKGQLEPADLQHVIDLYDEEILANDDELGVLCDELKARGLWDDTIVVVLSDHGEEFHEHGGFGHGTVLWQELLHVPLVIKPDRREGDSAGRRVAERVRVMDLAPTLLERMGVPPGSWQFMGQSLAAAFTGGEIQDDLPVIAEEYPDKRALIQGRWKWIWFGPTPRFPQPRVWLYDLEADPGEMRSLPAADPETAGRMQELFQRIVADYQSRGFQRIAGIAQHLASEDVDALRKLGYAVGEEEGDAFAPEELIEDEPADERDPEEEASDARTEGGGAATPAATPPRGG